MALFDLHTIDTAPEAARPLLKESAKAFGRIPNLHAVMAESPEHLEAYKNLHELFERPCVNSRWRLFASGACWIRSR